jgi:hypothetical protein
VLGSRGLVGSLAVMNEGEIECRRETEKEDGRLEEEQNVARRSNKPHGQFFWDMSNACYKLFRQNLHV